MLSGAFLPLFCHSKQIKYIRLFSLHIKIVKAFTFRTIIWLLSCDRECLIFFILKVYKFIYFYVFIYTFLIIYIYIYLEGRA